MKVLVACEFSGTVRDAFKWAGHHAVSCDLLPTERPGHHVQGDVRPLLQQPWDLIVAHPPCTYLCIMSQCRIYEPGRIDAIGPASEFFLECLHSNAPMIAVENPRMHKWGLNAVGVKPNFWIEPWQFGHEKKKRTFFWTKNLPPLMPTQIMQKRETWARQVPGWRGEGQKIRSRTFPGVARAMAEQWGSLQ